ncbi:hypothetical protein [Flagellimonas allohymeniacidonis]|nr:hypothetical protein [Allomuricauda hymeniacidonis]
MELFQHILAYLILTLAVAYLVWKFFLPKSLVSFGKKNTKACGDDDCGCH